MSKKITLLYLYPDEMNIYGDAGNVLTLQRRLEWHGYQPEVTYHHVGDKLNTKADILVGGGGQDSGQLKVYEDLQKNGPELKEMADRGVPMLMICGLYQLFGHRFITHEGAELPGIGIFDAETRATKTRLIGNVILDTDFGEIIGYENHSGQTFLLGEQQPFGTVTKGGGNNEKDKTDGAVYNNVFGTYLHGSLLPKNPEFADALIETAVTNRYGSCELQVVDDYFAEQARVIAAKRPR